MEIIIFFSFMKGPSYHLGFMYMLLHIRREGVQYALLDELIIKHALYSTNVFKLLFLLGLI